MANNNINVVSIDHGAAERIIAEGGDLKQLKQAMGDIKADMDQQYYTDIFSNTDTSTIGSFEAGSWTSKFLLRDATTHERVAGQQVPTADKSVVREVVSFPNKERVTQPKYWLPEELAMAGMEGIASTALGGQLQTIRNELEKNTVLAMINAAKEMYLAGKQEHYQYNYDLENKTGQEILDDISAIVDKLLDGDADNLVKQTWTEADISTMINNKVWRKLTSMFSVMAVGSETQAKMLLKNTMPAGEMGGIVFYKTPGSIMGHAYPILIGTHGRYGSVLKKRRIRVFNEAPSRRAGELETYATYRDMNNVVLPETVFVFTTDTTAPTGANKKQTGQVKEQPKPKDKVVDKPAKQPKEEVATKEDIQDAVNE